MFVTLTISLISYPFLGYRKSFKMYWWFSKKLFFFSIFCLYEGLTREFCFDTSSSLMFSFVSGKYPVIGFKIDSLSLIFASTTLIIGFNTMVFQYTYMSDDVKKDKFYFFFSYFTFSMVALVLSNNLMLFLLCWEFLGITSFFLIAHYDSRYTTIKSALKAFTFNRISDILLLLALILHYNTYGDFFMHYDSTLTNCGCKITSLSLYCIILASFVKSAQSVFMFWLPDSMEAPIPASALIHSATLVSAGVYLVLRFKSAINLDPNLESLILISSLYTITLLCSIIMIQTDIKRLLAMSTIVNISVIYIMAVTVDHIYTCCYFITHGLFKSGSFLSLGLIILKNKHNQDLRSYTNIKYLGYGGELLFLNTFFLSGFNLTHVYNIKHLITAHNFFYIEGSVFFDTMFALYSIFSAMYALILFYRVFIKLSSSSIKNEYTSSLKREEKFFKGHWDWVKEYLLLSLGVTLLINSIAYCSVDFSQAVIYTENTRYETGTMVFVSILILTHCILTATVKERFNYNSAYITSILLMLCILFLVV